MDHTNGEKRKMEETKVKETDVAETGKEKQKPIKTFRARTLSVSIWENKQKDGNTTYSIQPTRSYRDKDNNWHKTQSLFEKDLLVMAELLRKAWDFVTNREST